MPRYRLLTALLLAGAAVTAAAAPARPVKVMIISMFDKEADIWNDKLQLTQSIACPACRRATRWCIATPTTSAS